MPRSSFDHEAIAAEIDRIRSLSVDALRRLWSRTFRASPPPGFTKDLIARFLCWHIQEQALGGLSRKPRSISPASRRALGLEQIALSVSSRAPCLCANTRASSTPSPSLRMALSGAKQPMPASPPSPGPSPARTGMDRASLVLGSIKRRQSRRRKPMRRLDPPMDEVLAAKGRPSGNAAPAHSSLGDGKHGQ
jgi:Protein of unknown function (DUF2924)